MSATKRQLTGVDEFLDWRPLEFVDEIPETFECTMCGVIPAFPKRILTCCHVFCPACFENIADRERICPLDHGPFASETVETLDSSRAGLKELRVLCPNSLRGCTFISKVSKLQQHFLEHCRLAEVQCPRCGAAMPQMEAVDHYLGQCSERPAAKFGVGRKATSFDFTGAAAPSGESSRENSSGSFGGSSARRRKKTRSVAKSSTVRSGSSAETASTAAAAKDPVVALIKYQLDAGSSSRSASGGSSKDPSRESSLIKGSSEAKSNRKKGSNASKGADSVPKVSSRKDQSVGKAVASSRKAVSSVQKSLSTAATSKQQAPSVSGDLSMTPSAAKPAAGALRSETPGSPRNKTVGSLQNITVATAQPVGFAFSYLTDIEEAETRLTCGQEVVLRSDSFPMGDSSFRVHARLRRDKDGVVLASFALCVCGGTCQRIAEWSRSTAMNLVLVHPWDQSRNMRLPLVPNPDYVSLPPGAHLGRWDFWSPTEELKLLDLKARGFFSSGSLCVAVEIE